VGGERSVPAPDPIARDYLLLALRLDRHLAGLVDGYFGPRDLKSRVELEDLRPPADLALEAQELRERVGREALEPDRARWLDRQIQALHTQASALAGVRRSYVETVRLSFDAVPEPLSDAEYVAVHAELDQLLPGSGALGQRLAAWEARWVIPDHRVEAVAAWLVARIRDLATPVFPAPNEESLRVSVVRGQPWTGYNWYDGGLRSRIDLNADLPVHAIELVETLTHETYLGHHLEHTWKEARLVGELGRLEASILLINTPECYVSEGLAQLGRDLVLDLDAWVELVGGAHRIAGIATKPDEAERQVRIGLAMQRLRGARGDAALLLHVEARPRDEVRRFLEERTLVSPEVAEKRLEFIEHPLWRTYVFCYAGGERLLRAWCAAAGSAAGGQARFRRLLTEQLTPSEIATDLGRA
jgi:hypothetical protein